MQTRLLFMLILAVDHAAVNAAVSAWYRRSFCRDDNFLGARAPDAVQRFFGRAVFTVGVLCRRDPGAGPTERSGRPDLLRALVGPYRGCKSAGWLLASLVWA